MKSTTDSDEGKPASGNAAILVLLAIVLLLPLLYVLGIGPAAFYYHTHGRPEWLATLYRPLEILCGVSPTLQQALQWYVSLWLGLKSE